MTDLIIDYLYKEEGDYIHRNPTEDDITSPGGIYRKEHPEATIWEYIDYVANDLGLLVSSEYWTQEDIDLVNQHIDKDVIRELVKEFYDIYLKGAHLDLFNDELKIVILNFYTNSNVGCWKSIQRSIWDLYEERLINVDEEQISIVDGAFGYKTQVCLKIIKEQDITLNTLFKYMILENMLTYYSKLATTYPERYGMYLSNWTKRVNRLKGLKTKGIEL